MADSTISDADSQVSWQSCFWALVPLALSTMTQPTGKVFYTLPSHVGFYLRVSPIICALDATGTLVVYLRYLCLTVSFRHAATLVMDARTRDHLFGEWGISRRAQSTTDVTTRVNSLQALESIASVRWLIFMLGALPQAIKIFAMSSILWTKALAAMFVTSYCIFELIDAASAPPDSFDRGFSKAALMLPLIFVPGLSVWFSFLAHGYPWLIWTPEIYLAMCQHFGGDPLVIGVSGPLRYLGLFTSLLPVLLLAALVVCWRHLSEDSAVYMDHPLVYLVTAVFVPSLVLASGGADTVEYLAAVCGMTCSMVFAVFCSATAVGLHQTTIGRTQALFLPPDQTRLLDSPSNHLQENGATLSPDEMRSMQAEEISLEGAPELLANAAFTFFCMVSTHAVLGYIFCFDPQGTFKPAWTADLG